MWPSEPMPRICRSMPPHSPDPLLVPLAERRVVVGRARGDVDVLLRDVDVLEEVLVHEVVVALRMVLRQAHVLVEIEGGDLGEVEPLVLVHPHQFLVKPSGVEPVASPSTALGFALRVRATTRAATALISSYVSLMMISTAVTSSWGIERNDTHGQPAAGAAGKKQRAPSMTGSGVAWAARLWPRQVKSNRQYPLGRTQVSPWIRGMSTSGKPFRRRV